MSQRLDGVRDANRGLGFLSRYSSFRRAVYVDALVRICARAIREDRPYRDRNRFTKAPSENKGMAKKQKCKPEIIFLFR